MTKQGPGDTYICRWNFHCVGDWTEEISSHVWSLLCDITPTWSRFRANISRARVAKSQISMHYKTGVLYLSIPPRKPRFSGPVGCACCWFCIWLLCSESWNISLYEKPTMGRNLHAGFVAKRDTRFLVHKLFRQFPVVVEAVPPVVPPAASPPWSRCRHSARVVVPVAHLPQSYPSWSLTVAAESY